MSSERLLNALGKVDEELIIEAAPENAPKKAKKYSWIKWGALAACACLVVGIGAIAISGGDIGGALTGADDAKPEEPCVDIEPYKKLSVVEAISYEPYGELFPRVILDGYVLEDNTVGLYDSKVMKAVYCNNITEDVMTITISDKGYFDNVELNTVLEDGQNGSKIYMDTVDCVVCYSFSTININDIEDFEKMKSSAFAFEE